MHAELFKFFCAAFSAPQFRRWVRLLAPDGHALAQALPGGHVDALTLFHEGADLLIRQSYVDAAFFTALGREFPKRHAELAALAGTCNVHWVAPAVPTGTPPIPRYRWVGLAVTLFLAGALGQQLWVRSADEVHAEIERTEAATAPVAAFIRFIHIPDHETGAGGTAKPIAPALEPKPRLVEPRAVEPRPEPDRPEAAALEPQPPALKLPDAASSATCELPEALRAELRALAQRVLTSPGVSKEFTVTLPSGAARPRVSPAPRAGETAINQLYTHLKGLSAADLGNCRDRSIDVYFSLDKTTVEFHE